MATKWRNYIEHWEDYKTLLPNNPTIKQLDTSAATDKEIRKEIVVGTHAAKSFLATSREMADKILPNNKCLFVVNILSEKGKKINSLTIGVNQRLALYNLTATVLN